MPQKREQGQMLRRTAVIAVYSITFAVLILFAVMNRKPDAEPVYGSMDGRFDSKIVIEQDGATYHYREMEISNYLLIGVDNEEGTNDGQADVLVLLSVDRRNKTITPIMIDRDTIAQVTTYGVFGNVSGEKQMQLCLAQAFHSRNATGSVNTVSALSRLLYGVPIEHYVAVDIDGITLLNDVIGGVEVVLADDFSALDPEMVQGASIKLEGKQAELFVRSRMNVADGTNVSRMKRQRLYLESLLSQLFASSDEQDILFEEALEKLDGHYETDMTDSVILSTLQKYDDYEWQSFMVLPGDYRVGTDGFSEFWLDEFQTQQILTALWFR